MNDKWQEYEKKKADLHKKYNRLRWRPRIICLGYNIIADILIFSFLSGTKLPFGVIICVLSTVISLVYMLKATGELTKIEKQQETILINEAPVGKFKV
ncbi:MAG: hypothetical protein IKZ25_02005 [Clostridia bacterium]|nr:hypothetical protein [Clostridia bacterium]